MTDIIERLSCGSLIQHGPYNDRIYLLKASNTDLYSLPLRLVELAKEKGYGKIFAKLSEMRSLPFLSERYIVEARIPDMYPRKRDGIFLAYYLEKDRKIEEQKPLYEKNLNLAMQKRGAGPATLSSEKYKIRECSEDDIPSMKKVYEDVFPTYPFPIHETSYLKKTMIDNVDYYCTEKDGKIIALSSAEKDEENRFAEMTDFATLPDWRGQRLAQRLLHKMEISI